MSESILEMKMELLGTDVVVLGEIKKVNLPMVIDTMIKKSPFTGRLRKNIGSPKSYWMLLTNLEKGAPTKNEYTEPKKGDIVYAPIQDSIFLIYEDNPPISMTIYLLGHITDGIEKLTDPGRPTSCRITITDISDKE